MEACVHDANRRSTHVQLPSAGGAALDLHLAVVPVAGAVGASSRLETIPLRPISQAVAKSRRASASTGST